MDHHNADDIDIEHFGSDMNTQSENNTMSVSGPLGGGGSQSRVIGKKPKMTSNVWQVFDLHESEDNNGNKIHSAICKLCNTSLVAGARNGTNHLKRHMEKCLAKHGPQDPKQQQLARPSGSGGKVCTFTYSQSKMRIGLAVYIASAELPFSLVEDRRFIKFIKNFLQPAYINISRNTCRSDCLKVYDDMKKNLISEFYNFNGMIALTSDTWTGSNRIGYMSVTAHYIDTDWILHKKIIAFRMLEYPHTAVAIYRSILNVCREYGIINKIFSITFDNASANTGSIDLFIKHMHPPHGRKFFHMRCVCHIINLIVQDGIKLIETHIEKIRDAILYISSSPSRQQDFFQNCISYGLPCRKFKSDIRTRWNSTYLMLKSCVRYDKVITEFYNSKHETTILHEHHWDMAFTFMQFLRVFYDATNACSGVYYPTPCLVLNHLCNISSVFSRYITDPYFKDICKIMEEKFLKYWQETPPIFLLASILDPRIKLQGVEALVFEISQNLTVSLQNYDISQGLIDLYNGYEERYGANKSTQSNVDPITDDYSWSVIARTGRQRSGSGSMRSELYRYLETDLLDFLTKEELKVLSILDWWKQHQDIFPILSIMARDLLTPPVSTVASESAFSAGNRVLDDRRSRLTPDILECLICLKDWDDAAERAQNYTDDLIEDFTNLDN